VPFRALSAFVLFAAVGCSTTPSSTVGVPLGSEFILKPGETARVQSTDLRVTFVQVSNDSRCPGDALCVWAGDAILALRVGSADVELRSNTAPAQPVGTYTVRVQRVEPYPFTSKIIAPDDYRAVFVVTQH